MIDDRLNSASADKLRRELGYWRELSRTLTAGIEQAQARRDALLAICIDTTAPRYLEALRLAPADLAGRRVLDLGCGPHCGVIGLEGATTFGVDPLLAAYRGLGYPLDLHPTRYVAASSERLPFRSATFDAVVSVNALDHVDDVEKTVAEIARVLRPGGRLLAQINFHTDPTPTEPHCFNHPRLLTLFLREFHLLEVVYQGYVPEADEFRYYYQLSKGSPSGLKEWP